MTLTRYLNRLLLVRFAVILFTVAGFAILLDVLDVGTKVLRRTDDSYLALARYMLIRLPTLLTDLLPLTALLASLVMAFDLLRHGELVIIWSAGISRMGLVLRLLPVALLLMSGKLWLDDWAVPRTLPSLRALGLVELGQPVGVSAGWLWVSSGTDIIRLRSGEAESGPVLIFALDGQGKLQERIEAAWATPVEGGWLLHHVLRRPIAGQPPRRLDELFWPVTIEPGKLALMSRPPQELTFRDLATIVRAEGFGVAGTEGFATVLHGRLAGAATMLMMAILGPALVRKAPRRAAALPLFASGLTVGFVVMIAQGTLLAFGEVGLLRPALAAWTMPALLLVSLLWLAGVTAHGPGAHRATRRLAMPLRAPPQPLGGR